MIHTTVQRIPIHSICRLTLLQTVLFERAVLKDSWTTDSVYRYPRERVEANSRAKFACDSASAHSVFFHTAGRALPYVLSCAFFSWIRIVGVSLYGEEVVCSSCVTMDGTESRDHVLIGEWSDCGWGKQFSSCMYWGLGESRHHLLLGGEGDYEWAMESS